MLIVMPEWEADHMKVQIGIFLLVVWKDKTAEAVEWRWKVSIVATSGCTPLFLEGGNATCRSDAKQKVLTAFRKAVGAQEE